MIIPGMFFPVTTL